MSSSKYVPSILFLLPSLPLEGVVKESICCASTTFPARLRSAFSTARSIAVSRSYKRGERKCRRKKTRKKSGKQYCIGRRSEVRGQEVAM
eukprot:scaffold5554_cov159-Cylindrotheca_fusiformis.AAC.2